MYRFQQGDGSKSHDEILAQINEEKEKRLQRAEKFGIESQDLQKSKKLERLERFAGTSGAIESVDDAKKKIAERKARFGESGGSNKVDRLEMSLDDIKSKTFKKKFKGHGFKNKNNRIGGGKPHFKGGRKFRR